ncbi:MAG: hypothetical protein WC346_15870 [Methanogenium sp.]|jgi:hypothetical protein
MSDLFQSYANTVLDSSDVTLPVLNKVDAFEFITSPDYLNVDPFPIQRVVIKSFYNLWEKYPPDKEEQEIIDILKNNWKININLLRTDPIKVLVLCLGRRGGKSRLLSFIATYAMYELITLGNPQAHYNIMERHPIHVVHIAAKDKQAREMFAFTSDNIRRVPFFQPYMDFDKNNMTELRLFTPYDLALNEDIRRKNRIITRGSKRTPLLPGSLLVESITTSGATSRGKSIYLLMFSELAHFLRTNIDTSEDTLVAENPQSDYAVVKAMTPSVLDFGEDGRVIMESSPREKGGEFYHHYCIGGGMEQENFENLTFEPSYQVIQLSTWEARPSITRESLNAEFRKDPIGAMMEYGSHFGNPSGQFISEAVIDNIPQIGRPLIRYAAGTYHSFITIDPGGKAKKKVADTYAIAWGHYDHAPKEENVIYWIDGMKGFDATTHYIGSGQVEKITVDPNAVMKWLLDLVKDLGGKGFTDEIAYDQFDSTQPVSMLQALGLYAIETTFTNSYKAEMYGDFLQKAQQGQVRMYGVDVDPERWIERWKLEMKYLQQDISGNMVYFHHPSSGPVRHDDFADVCANLVHRMCLRVSPTKESAAEVRRAGLRPITMNRGYRPVIGKPLWGSNLSRH